MSGPAPRRGRRPAGNCRLTARRDARPDGPRPMPRCRSHPESELEPRKRGWYCEECGTNVLTFEQLPRTPEASAPAAADP